MFSKFFESNNPLLLIPVFIIGSFFWINAFINPPDVVNTANIAMFYKSIFHVFNKTPFLSVLFAYILVFIQAYIIFNIIQQNKLINKNSFISLLIYILLMSAINNLQTLSPVLFANLFILLSIRIIMNIYGSDEPFHQVFMSGLLISIASLFYFPASFFLLIIFISFIIYKIFKWREWLIVIIGFALPYFFISVFLFLTDNFFITFQKYRNYILDIKFINYHHTLHEKIFIILMGLLILFSVFNIIFTNRAKLIKIRLSFIFFLWFLLITIFFMFIGNDNTSIFFMIIYIPLTIILSNFIMHLRYPLIREFFFTLFIIAIIFAKYFI